MSTFAEPSVNGIRVVGVGELMTHGVPLDANVLVLEDHTLVLTRQGTVHRLIENDGRVAEAPMTSAQRSHAIALFGIDE